MELLEKHINNKNKLFEQLQGINDISKKNREAENWAAKFIAAVVRNYMEDFHCKYLSDAQMKELNPIIRNAIYTAIVVMDENPTAAAAYASMYVPPYWEDCELLKL